MQRDRERKNPYGLRERVYRIGLTTPSIPSFPYKASKQNFDIITGEITMMDNGSNSYPNTNLNSEQSLINNALSDNPTPTPNPVPTPPEATLEERFTTLESEYHFLKNNFTQLYDACNEMVERLEQLETRVRV